MKVRHTFRTFVILSVLLFPFCVQAQGNAERGRALSADCEACHGVGGENRIEGFPNLANQNAKYLIKQLREMRNSAKVRYGEKAPPKPDIAALLRARRSNEIMDPFVVHLSNQDIEDLAVYYAAQPCHAMITGAPLPPPRFEVRCRVCHGDYGIAENRNLPNIAGQDVVYLTRQLLDLKAAAEDGDKKRRARIMEGQVRHLSESDIRDISLYYARLPCR